ncbi:MAG: hypothetical protein VCB43_10995 [Myxococcota bacterium]
MDLRPGGANEVAQSCRVVMAMKHEPAILIFSRHAMPTLDRTHLAPASEVAKGAYVLKDPSGGKPEVILMANGSEAVLSSQIHARVSVEQASSFGWERDVGNEACCIGMDTFGASAPRSELQKKFGCTAEHVTNMAKEQISKQGGDA